MNAPAVVMEHELTAIDAFARWCACGERFTIEHLGAVALAALNVPPSPTEIREQRAAERVQRRLERTRQVLAEQQAYEERLGRRADALGLDFADRADWLIENRRPRRRYNLNGEPIVYDYDDPDTAPGGHDDRAEQRAHDEAERARIEALIERSSIGTVAAQQARDSVSYATALAVVERATELEAGIDLAGRRHVLNIEPSGWAYIAPHLWEADDSCRLLAFAADVFMGGSLEFGMVSVMPPGRYWCSLDDDGNFAIGGRLAEVPA